MSVCVASRLVAFAAQAACSLASRSLPTVASTAKSVSTISKIHSAGFTCRGMSSPRLPK